MSLNRSMRHAIQILEKKLHELTSKSHAGLSFLSVTSVAIFNSGIPGKDLGRSPNSSLQLKFQKFSRERIVKESK